MQRLRRNRAIVPVHAAFSAESVGCPYTSAIGGGRAQKWAFCLSFARFIGLMEQTITGKQSLTRFRRRNFLQFVEFRMMSFPQAT
jgi:hypothetical protein